LIADPTEASFDLSGDTLRISGDLSMQEENAFKDALDRLFETGAEAMVVDLSGVRYLGSSYVRHVAMLIIRGTQKGRTVTIRAHERAARMLRMGALDKIGKIEVVGGGE
jgi:anti-anti-sigma factor